jgi:hypothetical protein
MIRTLRYLVMTMIATTPSLAFAGDLEWQYIGAASFGHGLSCATGDVTVSSAGNDLAIVYGSSMAVDLARKEVR